MSATWGFGEWFFILWMVCYLFTFIILIYVDRNIEHWLSHSLICIFFWPIIWLYWMWPSDKK
ncbi:MAG: hypothetical protein IKC77_03180 [Lentisphaeria bacterium]|nr:hypothetical protein [Lentisphaeria bacterium]